MAILHDKFHCTAASNSGTSSIGDRSAAIGVFPEEHASEAQPLVSQAETPPHQSTSLARRERDPPSPSAPPHRQKARRTSTNSGRVGPDLDTGIFFSAQNHMGRSFSGRCLTSPLQDLHRPYGCWIVEHNALRLLIGQPSVVGRSSDCQHSEIAVRAPTTTAIFRTFDSPKSAEVAQANPAPQPQAKLPDIPQNLVKCIEAVQQPKDKTANAKVAALHLTAERAKNARRPFWLGIGSCRRLRFCGRHLPQMWRRRT